MQYGYIFSKEGEITGEQDTLRYSAYDTWLKSPASYREKYYGGKNFTTPETVFGHEMHKIMEKPGLRNKHPVLKNVPAYPKVERDIVLFLGNKEHGVKIGGRIDSFNPETGAFIDYKFSHRNKDGKVPWDNVKVARHRQMVFYSLLIKQKDGKVAQHHDLIWIETRFGKETRVFDGIVLESDSRKLELTGDFFIFRRRVTNDDRERMKADIIKVAHEIDEDFKKYKHEN